MQVLQASDLEIPAHTIARDGRKCTVHFDCPGAKVVAVSAEALARLEKEDLYELCRAEFKRRLEACGLAPAQYGEPGAFCVRWKKNEAG